MSMDMYRNKRTPEGKIDFKWGEGRTRQSEKAYADINKIMRKYAKTGVLPPQTRQGFFADVSKCGDYREALARVEQADKLFWNLDPEIRKKFANDPAQFLDYVAVPGNLDSLEELGLISEDVEAPPPVEKSAPLEEVKPAAEPQETE